MEPAVFLGREDRSRDRGRQPRSGGVPQRAAARQQLGLRRHLEGQEERPARKAQAQTRQRAFGLRHRQEPETHQGLLVREGLPQHGGLDAHHQRHAAPADGQRNLPDRPQTQSQDRQDQLHGQRAVQGQAPAPDLQEDAPEEHQLLPRHQTQRERLRERQGPADRLLQLERLPQRHDRQRLDLSDQRQAAGHRPRHFGRQQILHPQRVVGRQLGVRNRRPAAHVRRQQGRHVRQEVDAQASGHRQGDRSRSNVRIVALPEQGLPDVADRTRRNHHRRRLDRHRGQGIRRQAVHHQRSRHHGQPARGRRGDTPRALHPSGRALRPLAAHADYPHARLAGPLQPRSDHARHQTRFERAGERQLAARRAGLRPVQHRRRLGFGNVRRIGGHHAQQPFDQELLQEGRMAPLPDGPEPAAVAVGADQRHLLQGVRPEFHRPVAGRQEAQFVHHIGPLLRAEQRLLRMAEEYAVLPHVRSGGRSGQASQLARPLLHALRRGELRTLLAQKLEYVRHDQRRRQPALAQIRLRTQLGGPADLSAPRFGVQRIGAVHAPLLALGRQRLQEAGGACQQHGQQGGGQSKSGALPLGRVPQVAVQGAVVPSADQELESRADAQGRNGLPRQLQQI